LTEITSQRRRGLASVIAGGIGNTNNGDYASIPGGYQNLASGTNSFAAGSYAQATNGGSLSGQTLLPARLLPQPRTIPSTSAPRAACISPRAVAGMSWTAL